MIMGWKTLTIIGIWLLLIARPVVAQDLGPHFLKIRDGIYVYGRDDIPGRDPTSAERNRKLMAQSNEMRDAFRDFRLVMPHIEFADRLVLNMGDRALELLQLNRIHSDADTAIWLPKERVLFSAATAAVKRFAFFLAFVTIENVKAALKKLKALNPPDVVVPAHGAPGTVQLLNETDTFYDVLLDRV